MCASVYTCIMCVFVCVFVCLLVCVCLFVYAVCACVCVCVCVCVRERESVCVLGCTVGPLYYKPLNCRNLCNKGTILSPSVVL